MAKLATMMLLLIAVQFCLYVFAGQTPTGTAETSLWNFVWDPSNWSSAEFLLGFATVAGLITGVGFFAAISVGATLGFVTDFMMFAVMVVGLMEIGVVLGALYTQVNNWLTGFICSCVGQNPCSLACQATIGACSVCYEARLIASILIGPIAFLYIWTVIEWWRGKDI